MADGIDLDPGTGGAKVATDDDGTAHHQYVKLEFGADNTQTKVSGANPLPVQISDGTDTALVDGSGNLQVGGTVAVSGTVAVTQSGTWDEVGINDSGNSITVDNGGTFAVQAAQSGTWTVQPGNTANTTAWKVDGSAVTQPVSGTVTANMGTVTADPFGANADAASATGSISAKLRFIASTGIPVTGTVTVGSHAVTNAGTFAVQDSEKIADDAAFTVASTKVMPIGLLADETSPDSVNEGDIGAPRMTLDRMIRVVSEQSDTIRANGTSRTISKAAIAAATSGNNTLVTNSNGGLTVRVYALTIVATAAVSLYFTADAGGTVVFGGSTNKISLAANSGLVLPFNPAGWFDTSANTDVVMNLSGAVAVSGGIVYAEV